MHFTIYTKWEKWKKGNKNQRQTMSIKPSIEKLYRIPSCSVIYHSSHFLFSPFLSMYPIYDCLPLIPQPAKSIRTWQKGAQSPTYQSTWEKKSTWTKETQLCRSIEPNLKSRNFVVKERKCGRVVTKVCSLSLLEWNSCAFYNLELTENAGTSFRNLPHF